MTTPILAIHQLHKKFGDKAVLKGVDFTVYPGEVIGYIGTNGAGKTTTVKIILGMLQKSEGNIEIFGEEMKDDDETYKRYIGYVPENAELYETLTVREYYHFLGGLYGMSVPVIDQRALGMLKALSMDDSYDHRLSSFSKGMRQKVLIVASLLHNPDLLFWDEPLSGLDANSVQIIKALLKELKKAGKTIFYSSHIMDTVQQVSDRIIILNNGVVEADGPFDELSAESNSNLEELFNKLTGFTEHQVLAENIVSYMRGAVSDESEGSTETSI